MNDCPRQNPAYRPSQLYILVISDTFRLDLDLFELDNKLGCFMQTLNYQTSPEIQNVIDSMGRTEDAKFSADGRHLAIVDFLTDKVYLFGIEIEGNASNQVIYIKSCLTITSDAFRLPHGLVFLGKNHFVVVNRGADITLFEFDFKFSGCKEKKLTPVKYVMGRRFYGKVSSPGSVGSYQVSDNCYRIFVCNNYLHNIVSFEITLGNTIKIKNGLNLPDGICISPNKKWVAISNHYTGTISIYKVSPLLNRFTSPSATLLNIAYPHGLRFSEDGKKVFSTDAGSQYLHVFESDSDSWQGDYKPRQSIKLVDKETFGKVRINPEEGGLKGLDVTNDDQLLVTTAEHQVLKFYSISDLLELPRSSVEQYLIKEKMKFYRSLEKGLPPEPEVGFEQQMQA